jgi:hypothetical protein
VRKCAALPYRLPLSGDGPCPHPNVRACWPSKLFSRNWSSPLKFLPEAIAAMVAVALMVVIYMFYNPTKDALSIYDYQTLIGTMGALLTALIAYSAASLNTRWNRHNEMQKTIASNFQKLLVLYQQLSYIVDEYFSMSPYLSADNKDETVNAGLAKFNERVDHHFSDIQTSMTDVIFLLDNKSKNAYLYNYNFFSNANHSKFTAPMTIVRFDIFLQYGTISRLWSSASPRLPALMQRMTG